MSDFSEDCVLLVLADADYDELDYIREYETFKKIVRGIT
ncbi:dTDP-6-deoxy-3,4-keto-hexulose isomerase [Escherichia coli O91:H21 str. B2F1]|nr:dTDP-6-deoxy-3,4-keto-hexulose isomerase [Escherichia coli O91:H21 str. B2F1]